MEEELDPKERWGRLPRNAATLLRGFETLPPPNIYLIPVAYLGPQRNIKISMNAGSYTCARDG